MVITPSDLSKHHDELRRARRHLGFWQARELVLAGTASPSIATRNSALQLFDIEARMQVVLAKAEASQNEQDAKVKKIIQNYLGRDENLPTHEGGWSRFESVESAIEKLTDLAAFNHAKLEDSLNSCQKHHEVAIADMKKTLDERDLSSFRQNGEMLRKSRRPWM